MCGRYTLSAPADLLHDLFELETGVEVSPRFNIAPSQEAAAVRVDSSDGSRRLDHFRWGLVPFWAKDAGIGNRMINARAETVMDKPAYRSSFRRKRCLVIATGFYEWQQTGGPKQPFFFQMIGGQPFAMAGLWDRWEKGDEPLETFTIITTHPNEVVEPVHKRMPVILQPADYAAWLDPEQDDKASLSSLLGPFPAALMEGYPVSTYVNNPANEGPRCSEPMGQPPGLTSE